MIIPTVEIAGYVTGNFQKLLLNLTMISPHQQNLILQIASRLKPKMVGVFGSYARGENGNSSDLDILVDFEQSVNLLEIIGLEQELSEKLGIKVDLVTVRALNPMLKQYIEKDLIVLKA